MLCDKQSFTLEETLTSLDFFLSEYFFQHNMWLSDSDHCELSGQEKLIIQDRSINLYRYVRMLYPYVYDKQFDLNGTDFSYSATHAYPFITEPESLMVAVVQLYLFWASFVGKNFYGNTLDDENAQALNVLVTDAYLRFRIDFGWIGAFILHAPSSSSENSLAQTPSLFTYGELEHVTSLAGVTLRGKANGMSNITINLRKKSGEVIIKRRDGDGVSKPYYNADGAKEISPAGNQIPVSLTPFFEGKVGGSVKKLLEHREAVPLLATLKGYQPTQFIAPANEPFPPYDDSAKIHAAVSGWLGRDTTALANLMEFLGTTGINRRNMKYKFWREMETGKVKLSLVTLAAINTFMTEVEGNHESDNPWQPLWNAYQSV